MVSAELIVGGAGCLLFGLPSWRWKMFMAKELLRIAGGNGSEQMQCERTAWKCNTARQIAEETGLSDFD